MRIAPTSMRMLVAAGAVAAGGGSVAATSLALRRDSDRTVEPADATADTDAAAGASQLTAPATPSTAVAPAARPTPGTHLLTFDKRAATPARSATDPAAFDALLRADGPGWAAADGTLSVPLPDGRVLWLFADTILHLPGADGALRRNADFVRNSAVLHDGRTATTIVTGTERDADDFVKPAKAGEWYWPGHGTVEGDEVVLFMSRMEQTATGAPGWNMRQTGVDMLRMRLDDLSLIERVPMPDSKRLEWGTAVVSDDTHTYVYGFENEGEGEDINERYSHVARTAKGELHGGKLEYWDGRDWSPDPAKSKRIAKDLSNSYSVIRTPEGKWAMVSQQLLFGTELRAKLADSPQGPWSEWTTIDSGPTGEPGTISYNAQVHPAFTKDGKLLASWNYNRQDAQLPTASQLETYRPRFRAIEIDRLER